jgi:heme-degrading monooxygenase HmoA
MDVAQDADRDRAERAGQRVLRIDDLGAACEGFPGFPGARNAHQQAHRYVNLVIWSSNGTLNDVVPMNPTNEPINDQMTK